MDSRPRRGACPTTSKVCYIDRATAKRTIQKNHMPRVAAYKCGDCGFFHIGGWHGVKDRSAHSAGSVGTMPIETACKLLGVSVEFIERLIEAGKVGSEDGLPYRADIERIAAL